MKKSIKFFIYIFIIIISIYNFPICLYGSKNSSDCTLEIKNVDLIPGISYDFDVYIKRNPSWTNNTSLGTLLNTFNSVIVLNIREDAFCNLQVENLGSMIIGVDDTLFSDKIQVELISSDNPVPTNLEILCNIELEISNPNTTSELSWDISNTAIYDNSPYPGNERTTELLGSDNTYLPVDNSGNDLKKQSFIKLSTNPFYSDSQSIELTLKIPQSGQTVLNLYNEKGQFVSKIYKSAHQKNDRTTLFWDGRDNRGNKLSPGIYFLQLVIDNKSCAASKVVILR